MLWSKKELLRDQEIMYDKYDPMFDAWSCVTGDIRRAFDAQKFLSLYPSVGPIITAIRDKLHIQPKSTIRLCETRTNVDVADVLNDILLQVVTDMDKY